MPDAHHILVVDDSDEIVAYYTEILEEHGYRYSVAQDGRTAIESMKQNRPDLVLLDVMMPRKSGVGVFKKMKKDPDLASVPIVIITNNGNLPLYISAGEIIITPSLSFCSTVNAARPIQGAVFFPTGSMRIFSNGIL